MNQVDFERLLQNSLYFKGLPPQEQEQIRHSRGEQRRNYQNMFTDEVEMLAAACQEFEMGITSVQKEHHFNQLRQKQTAARQAEAQSQEVEIANLENVMNKI